VLIRVQKNQCKSVLIRVQKNQCKSVLIRVQKKQCKSVSEIQESDNIGQLVLRRLRSKSRPDFGLRMTPMIDMTFLLLIFFLVASNFRPAENFLPFQLPAAQAYGQPFGKVEPLTIHIFASAAGCRVQFGQGRTIRIEQQPTEADWAAMAQTLSNIMRDQRRTCNDPVEIICEGGVQWQYWANIYNVLFGMGIKDITIYKTE